MRCDGPVETLLCEDLGRSVRFGEGLGRGKSGWHGTRSVFSPRPVWAARAHRRWSPKTLRETIAAGVTNLKAVACCWTATERLLVPHWLAGAVVVRTPSQRLLCESLRLHLGIVAVGEDEAEQHQRRWRSGDGTLGKQSRLRVTSVEVELSVRPLSQSA